MAGPGLFDPLTVRGMTVRNRIMVSPMCQYSAGEDGLPNDWHFVHLGSRAVGGAGLIMVEATAVEPRGRISPQDLGIWSDDHIPAFRRVVDFCHAQGAKMGLQLAHAGRKARTHEPAVAPSPLPFQEGWATPEELDAAGIAAVVSAFGRGAARAVAAGFDCVEIHGAHGYLLHEFLSPLTNARTDGYGGSPERRRRLLLEVIAAVRANVPDDFPVFLRVSATDYAPGGLTADDQAETARAAHAAGVDLVDVSSGGAVPVPVPAYPAYQTEFARRIREVAGVPTAAVGLITTPELAEAIVRNGWADLVVLAREFLRNPYWPLHAARALGVDVPWPRQYERARWPR